MNNLSVRSMVPGTVAVHDDAWCETCKQKVPLKSMTVDGSTVYVLETHYPPTRGVRPRDAAHCMESGKQITIPLE